MFFVLLVNLYISRVLFRALGVSDYGSYVVVAGFVTLFGFFNTTLSSTMQRYYNYAGTRQTHMGILEVFSTGFRIQILIAVATMIVVETFGLWYMNHVLVIPAIRLPAAIMVFHASVISLVLLILQIPFTGLILSQERMGYYSFVSIVDIILKLLATLSIEYLPYDRLSAYAFLLTGISVIDLLMYAIYAKVSWRFIRIIKKVNREMLKSLLVFTGWNLIGTFAFMLRGQGISLLLNSFFGPVVNAARGFAMQVSNAIANFSSNITVAFAPQIVNSIAAEDSHRAENLMFSESKICYMLLLLLAVPLCLEIDYVLALWLGPKVPANTAIFSILMLIDAVICTLNTPCTQVTMATGRIRSYEISSSLVNLCLIPVCYIFLKIGFSAVSSFVITLVFSIILQSVCLVYTHRVFRFNIRRYIQTVLLPCLTATLLLPLLPLLLKLNMHPSFFRLICLCVADVVIAMPLFYFLVLNGQERLIAKKVIMESKCRLAA